MPTWIMPSCYALALLMLPCLVRSAEPPVAHEPTPGTSNASDWQDVEKLEVFPSAVMLCGRDDRQQLIVTARRSDARMLHRFDATREVTFRSANPKIASVTTDGVVHPQGSGRTEIEIRGPRRTVVVPVTIEQGAEFLPVSFEREIMPILTKAGCNSGGCHGKSGGRGGFQLSLFGFDPATDYETIVQGSRGRRLFPAQPLHSLVVAKPLGSVPHGGGLRLAADTPECQRLVRWIAGGAERSTGDEPQLSSIEVTPAGAMLRHHAGQQLTVTAVYSDGSRRDVTRVTEFRTNDPAVANVDELGLITAAAKTGETAIVCLFQGQVGVSRILTPLIKTDHATDRFGDLVASGEFPIANPIDTHILAKLRELNVRPSSIADDATFLRRASLQIAGRLPSASEVEAFLADSSAQKRGELVDRLLTDGGYADLFAQKWSDILRNKRRGQKERIPGTVGFHRWIRNAIATNMPYDQFVEAIITATGTPESCPPTQWYHEVRYLDRYVDDTAQVFLGVRIGCARCHHHPSENFSQEDYYGLAAFFARVGRRGGTGVAERRANETIFVLPAGEVKHPLTNEVVPPHGLGAEPVKIDRYGDPRSSLVDWMRRRDNPYFAKAFVNRMWAHFFGRGLVEPLDDLRQTNPATNEPLLEMLAEEFRTSGFDMRHVVRLIASSTTYQLSSEPNEDNLDETQSYARFYPQRLTAEVLLGAIDTATGVPTSFGGLPPGTTAVQLPDEDYTNSFLTLFGRPPRESACECERVAAPSLSQSLFLMNDKFFLDKVGAKKSLAEELAKPSGEEAESVDKLFLAALSRPPRDDERAKALAYIAKEEQPLEAYRNLLWVLLNTKEFMYVH
jgi:hypothetical protein